MIDVLLAAIMPIEARFPCHVQVSVAAKGWEREITQALGVYSALSGSQFTAGDGGIHFVVKPRKLGPSGVELGWWLGDTVTLTPAKQLTHFQRLSVVEHEFGHAYWAGHSTDPTSIMYPTITKNHLLNADDREFITSNGCREY